MTNGNGSLILNGIGDAELIMILQVKEKHEASLDFTPQQMQPQQVPTNQPGAGKKFYNNVKLRLERPRWPESRIPDC